MIPFYEWISITHSIDKDTKMAVKYFIFTWKFKQVSKYSQVKQFTADLIPSALNEEIKFKKWTKQKQRTFSQKGIF